MSEVKHMEIAKRLLDEYMEKGIPERKHRGLALEYMQMRRLTTGTMEP